MERPNIKHLFDTQLLSEKTKKHLQNVYYEMTIGLLVTALSCFVGQYMIELLSVLFIPLCIAQLGLIIYMVYSNSHNKHSYFYAFTALEGLTLTPLVHTANIIDNTIVFTALTTTIITFGSFSYLSLKTNKRSVLYFGGILASILFTLTIMSLVNLFLHSELLFKIELYLGLGLFCMYIIYDTQLVIKEADDGKYDVIKHAMTFYLDFINVFIRILIILMRNKNNKKKK